MHNQGQNSQATQCHTPAAAHHATHAGCCGAAKANHDAIAKRAYDIYLKSGSKPGRCQQNWQQAERDLQTAAH